MCIIALKPAGITLTESTLKNMWENNDDGAGFMYPDRGKVRVVKGLMTFSDFLKAYHRVGEHRKIVMHFRIRTHGAVSPQLTHPFWIQKGNLAMVHNGVISSVNHHGLPDESDTSLYAKILAHRYPDPIEALTNQEELEKIVKEIGWSKLVFMAGDGDHLIVNEKSGDWENGCWFSNRSHSNTYYRGGWNGYYGNYAGTGTTSGSTSTYNYKQSRQGFVFGEEDEDTNPHLTRPTAGLALRDQNADEKEWELLLARYEAKYGTVED